MPHQSKWMTSMIAKHGSEAAVRAFMRDASNKSRRNTGKGGFAALKQTDPERFRALSRKGGQTSRRSAPHETNTPHNQNQTEPK